MSILDWFRRKPKAALDEHSGAGAIPTVLRNARSMVAGVNVTADSALTFSAVFACVRVLAESVSSLPLILYRRQSDSSKSRASSHPLYGVLHDIANPETTSNTLIESMMSNVVLWGNGFSQIIPTADGNVGELWPLMSKYMQIARNKAGDLVFDYSEPGRARVFQRWEIWHVPGLTINGVTGLSVLGYWRRAIGLGLVLDTFTEEFFENGAKPGIVLRHPGTLGAEAMKNLRESWVEQHGGVENVNKPGILEEGMELETFGMPLDDAQFIESKKFQAEEVARLFRVPPHKVGIMDHATFSNIEHQSLEFVTDSLQPWLVRFEKRITLNLLLQADRGGYFAEFLLDALLRGDTLSRYQAYGRAILDGWMTRNEARRRENLNADDTRLDRYLVPLNMGVLGDTAPANSLPPVALSDHSLEAVLSGNGNGRH